MEINNPHDKFFKETFSNPDVVKALLVRTLPIEVVSLIDFENLQYGNTSYVSMDLKEVFSDLVIHANLIGLNISLKISILLEHKSYKDEYTILQLDEYIVKGYQAQYKKDGRLTLILPIVYYHSEEPWEMKNLNDFFNDYPPSFHAFVPNHETIFISLQKMSESEIEKFENQMLIASMLMQKNRNDPEKMSESMMRIMKSLDPYHQRNFIKSIMVYSTVTSIKKEDISKALINLPPNIQQDMITLAEQWKLEGELKGKLEGKLEEKKDVVINGHKNGLSIALLSNITELDESKIQEILKNAGLVD